jgi:hypothetical protein
MPGVLEGGVDEPPTLAIEDAAFRRPVRAIPEPLALGEDGLRVPRGNVENLGLRDHYDRVLDATADEDLAAS